MTDILIPSPVRVLEGQTTAFPKTVRAEQTITRAATANPAAYAAGKIVGDAARGAVIPFTSLNAVPGTMAGISSLALIRTLPGASAAKFKAFLFTAAPTGIAADYDNISAATAVNLFVGAASFDFGAEPGAFADGCRATAAFQTTFAPVNNSVFAVLVADGAYQPVAAEKFILRLNLLPDFYAGKYSVAS